MLLGVTATAHATVPETVCPSVGETVLTRSDPASAGTASNIKRSTSETAIVIELRRLCLAAVSSTSPSSVEDGSGGSLFFGIKLIEEFGTLTRDVVSCFDDQLDASAPL